MLLSEAVEANDLAQWALWRFTHCQWNGHCHTTFQLKGGHSTTELSPPQRNLFRQCLVSGDVMMCSWGVWGTNDTWKRIKLALTIYRDFMKSSFIRFWEERQCKPQTTGALSFASLPSNVIFSLFRGLLSGMAEMALSGEEDVGTGAQLPPK